MLTIFCSRLEQEAGQLLITVAIFLFHFTRFYGQRSLRACPLSLYKTFFQFSHGNYTHVHLHTRCSELSLLGCTCRASIVFWCQIVLNMLHGCPWASRTLQWFSQWCVCGGGGHALTCSTSRFTAVHRWLKSCHTARAPACVWRVVYIPSHSSCVLWQNTCKQVDERNAKWNVHGGP